MTRFTTRNLSSLGNQLTIQLAPDEEGYIGRECPVKDCLGYFKITPGTGLKGPAPSHCPYCGHREESKNFTTPAQSEFAKSVAIRQITDALHKHLKSLEFDHRPQRRIWHRHEPQGAVGHQAIDQALPREGTGNDSRLRPVHAPIRHTAYSRGARIAERTIHCKS